MTQSQSAAVAFTVVALLAAVLFIPALQNPFGGVILGGLIVLVIAGGALYAEWQARRQR